MINIAIVDDDIHICSHLCEYMERSMNSYSMNISEYESGIDFVSALDDGEKYDIVFMDIQMAPIDGIDAGKRLRATEYGRGSILIFISAYTDNLMPLFGLQPLDFVEKPLEYGKFVTVAQKIIDRLEEEQQYIFVKSNRKEQRLLLTDIMYAEILGGRQVKLHMTSDQDIITYERLSSILARINAVSSSMLQIHKSYFINKNHVRSFDNHEVIMSDDARLPISASFRAPVNKTLMNSLVHGGICDEF